MTAKGDHDESSDTRRNRFSRALLFGFGEVAMSQASQPGALHDVRDSDPIEATLTEQRARHVEHLFAIRRRLLARHPHGLPPCLNTT
jgi:hypothetical protein